jgi:TRAP-type C4-dicarboxylate transport system permease small subunit
MLIHFQKLLKLAGKGGLVVAGCVLLAMMLVVVGNILGRLALKAPITGTVEIVGLAGVILISIALIYTEKEHGHIVVSFATDRLPQRLQAILRKITLLLSFGTVVLLVWGGILIALERLREWTPILHLSAVTFRSIWVVCSIVLCGILLKYFFEQFRVRNTKK